MGGEREPQSLRAARRSPHARRRAAHLRTSTPAPGAGWSAGDALAAKEPDRGANIGARQVVRLGLLARCVLRAATTAASPRAAARESSSSSGSPAHSTARVLHTAQARRAAERSGGYALCAGRHHAAAARSVLVLSRTSGSDAAASSAASLRGWPAGSSGRVAACAGEGAVAPAGGDEQPRDADTCHGFVGDVQAASDTAVV